MNASRFRALLTGLLATLAATHIASAQGARPERSWHPREAQTAPAESAHRPRRHESQAQFRGHGQPRAVQTAPAAVGFGQDDERRTASRERQLAQEGKSEQGGRARGMSLHEAIKMVEKRFGARVVRRETRQENGRTVYVLRLFDEKSGRVWTVRVDAATGRLL